MTDAQFDRLVNALQGHGDQIGGNLVHLKRFLERLQQQDQTFLAEQRAASERAQDKAHRTSMFAAIAAGAAALAAISQAYAALTSQSECETKANPAAPPLSQATAAPN